MCPLLALHGAGGSASGQLAFMRPLAEQYGFALLAVSSRNTTWDAINREFGSDIDYLDQTLAFAFQRCNVDPARLGVEGFSDGASYTLALAVVNGDLFRRAIAFSPGFIPAFDDAANGDPEFFFSHGRQDTVLPIDCGTRRLAALLQADHYRVSVNEFDGVHGVPAEIADQAAQWLVETRAVPPSGQHQFESPRATPCIPRPD